MQMMLLEKPKYMELHVPQAMDHVLTVAAVQHQRLQDQHQHHHQLQVLVEAEAEAEAADV